MTVVCFNRDPVVAIFGVAAMDASMLAQVKFKFCLCGVGPVLWKQRWQAFKALNPDSDGMLTEERLVTVLANPKVVAYFQTLDVELWQNLCYL